MATLSVTDRNCEPGAFSGGPDLTAGEFRLWFEGDEAPPRAPQTTSLATLAGSQLVGGVMECHAPPWSGNPTLSTAFVEPASGAVLREGSSARFTPTPSDAGRELACVSIATNPGGTTEAISSNTVRVRNGRTLRADRLVKALRSVRHQARWSVTLRVLKPEVGQLARVHWSSRKCTRCTGVKWLKLRRRTRVTSPPLKSDAATLKLHLPTAESSTVIYRASVWKTRLPSARHR